MVEKKQLILNLLLFTFILLTNCASFKNVEKINIENSHKIINTYSNKCKSINNFKSDENLWKIINPKSKIEEDNLFVKFSLTRKKKLLVSLIKNNNIILEKKLKGKFEIDSCYYTKRKFLLVPILPILWFYKSEKMRIYSKKGKLVIEKRYRDGGVALFMAGGKNVNTSYKYERVNN